VQEEDLRSLMFGDYMNPDLEPEERMYEEVKSIDDFYTVAEQCLEEYNNTHKTRMNLVIFRYLSPYIGKSSCKMCSIIISTGLWYIVWY
jgi:dynein heavy chain